MTDTDFLAEILADGCWHSHTQILDLSLTLRGCGLTVHSRAADLRKRGHVVETRLERDQRGRCLSFYRLGALDDDAAAGVASSSSAPSNPEQTEFQPSSPSLPLRASNPTRDGGVLTLWGDAA